MTTHYSGPIVRTRSGSNINTAGDVTYTAAQLVSGIITRDPNGGARNDTTPTAAELIDAFNLEEDNQTAECYLINTADAAEAITLVAGANVTIANIGQTIAQNEAAILVIKRTAPTTVSIYVIGA